MFIDAWAADVPAVGRLLAVKHGPGPEERPPSYRAESGVLVDLRVSGPARG